MILTKLDSFSRFSLYGWLWQWLSLIQRQWQSLLLYQQSQSMLGKSFAHTISHKSVFEQTDAASRYFVGTANNPFTDPTNIAYPLDICVNYEVSLKWFNPIYKYAIYSCNADKNTVTMTTYDSDSTCSSDGTIDSVYTLDSFNQTGDLHSFNCDGDDNYAY